MPVETLHSHVTKMSNERRERGRIRMSQSERRLLISSKRPAWREWGQNPKLPMNHQGETHKSQLSSSIAFWKEFTHSLTQLSSFPDTHTHTEVSLCKYIRLWSQRTIHSFSELVLLLPLRNIIIYLKSRWLYFMFNLKICLRLSKGQADWSVIQHDVFYCLVFISGNDLYKPSQNHNVIKL